MANRWGKSENNDRFYFLGFQSHLDSDCSHKSKNAQKQALPRCLVLERKTMTKLDKALKSRGITLPTKVHIVKAMIFPVVMYRCENWSIRKPEHQRTDAFELWCWRRLLKVPWTVRRSNLSNSKGTQLWICIGRTEAEAEAPILWPPDVKKRLMLGKTEGKRRRERDKGWDGGWRHQLKGSKFEQTPEDSEGQGRLLCCSSRGHKESDTT